MTLLAKAQAYVPASNQFHVRTIIRHGGSMGRKMFLKAQRVRALFKKRLWIKRNRDKVNAYYRARRARPGELDLERERKRAWRAKNRDKVNAYYRRYDALTPGRKEYKAMKAREYRARDKVANAD